MAKLCVVTVGVVLAAEAIPEPDMTVPATLRARIAGKMIARPMRMTPPGVCRGHGPVARSRKADQRNYFIVRYCPAPGYSMRTVQTISTISTKLNSHLNLERKFGC